MMEVISLLDATLYNSVGYFLVALGILVSIRFLGYPDLTVDGSFTIGAAVFAISVKAQLPALASFLLVIIGGAIGGVLTGLINKFLQIGKIVSSIIVMILLITIVPYLSEGSTVGLLDESSLLASLQDSDLQLTRSLLPEAQFSLHIYFILTFFIFCGIIAFLLNRFFTKNYGIKIRYLGSALAPNLLKKKENIKLNLLGLGMGNALVALGGAVEAQRNGGFSQNMGVGVILIGLTVLVLGESILKTRYKRDHLSVPENIAAVFIGVFVYSFGLQLLLAYDITFFDVRLTTTVFLLLLLTLAARRHPNSGQLF